MTIDMTMKEAVDSFNGFDLIAIRQKLRDAACLDG